MKTPTAAKDTALERLIYLSDGIFAIAITLLVLEIRVPDISSQRQGQDLTSDLFGLTGAIATYALSFLIVSVYWMTHQRIFRYILRANSTLIWLNILFLMGVAFIPVPTNILGRYGDHKEAVIFYVISLLFSGLFTTIIWWYATYKHRLVDPNLDPGLIRHHLERSLVAPIIFLLSIPIAFLSPTLAEVSWLLIGVVILIHESVYRSRSKPRDSEKLPREKSSTVPR